MKKEFTQIGSIKLAGITAKTNNNSETNPETAKIGITMQKYFGENFPDQIKNRKNPKKTFCIYTNFESDHTGEYTYFIGEEVTSFDGIDKNLSTLTIPEQKYVKFTNSPGPMPEVCIAMWQETWKMTPEDFGGNRSYIADFEVYDERSLDPQNTILDIYIGIK